MSGHTAVHKMTRSDLHAKITLFAKELQLLQKIDQGCSGCDYSEHRRDGTCRKWNQTVPVDVRKVGCNEWVWDEIPF